MELKKIEDYELEELGKKRLLINKYGMDLLYTYEVNRYWKEFFFDVIDKLAQKRGFIIRQDEKSLFDDLKKDYYNLIERNNLDIDINDYIEINDYITFEEWLKDENHDYVIVKDGIYLLVK